MAVLDETEREMLRAVDGDLSTLQGAFEAAAAANALDQDFLDRMRSTANELVHRVNRDLPPHVDPDARDEIRRRLIDLLTLPAQSTMPLLDLADRALVEAEAVRHVVRDLIDEQPPAELRDAAAVIELLEGELPQLTVRQLSELLGMSDRQLQRRRLEGGPSSPRMQTVARLVGLLRRAWTDQGVFAWFSRPRDDLDGRAPIELLEDPASERMLLVAARAGRVQGGI